MVEHKCKKCGRIFNRKSTYDNHMKRKNPCVPNRKQTSPRISDSKIEITEYKCQKCNNIYLNNSNLKRHMVSCKELEKENNRIKELETELTLLKIKFDDEIKFYKNLINNAYNITNNTINIANNAMNFDGSTNSNIPIIETQEKSNLILIIGE
jgi:DNA-directed RNA polymerase subunit RPC12/RpoP